ncbi:HAD family hydrolase [Bdellovibrio bacteriovorus]|uniref:HAD family hydrolase n=1 Tax=Bdellovibrio bacteriovorus TaxID=959 RepID=UPI0035A6A92C
MSKFAHLVITTFILFSFSTYAAGPDPLPSWQEGKLKKSILDFVAEVTKAGGSRFVPPEDRIATFDNDGTLWSEVPTIEVEFTKNRLQEALKKNPNLKKQEPYLSLLKGTPVTQLSQKQILEVVALTHTGMSEEEFSKEVREFFRTALHPKLQVPYTQAVYQPMLELLAYLRANDFTLFISSGGEISFMREVATTIYGIPSQNIIGSYFVDKLDEKNGKLVAVRTSALALVNDKENKPIGILRHIGKRPILSVGNERSGGDIAHLRFSSESERPNLQIMINHDDEVREAAYSEKDGASLAAAKKYGFKILSIKNDWKQVFPSQKSIAKDF